MICRVRSFNDDKKTLSRNTLSFKADEKILFRIQFYDVKISYLTCVDTNYPAGIKIVLRRTWYVPGKAKTTIADVPGTYNRDAQGTFVRKSFVQ